jgi:putative 4-mercaptohistidine N1-methyltranferase
MSIYESPRLLAEYLLFHYAAVEEVLPWAFGPKDALGFAVRSVTELLDSHLLPTPTSRGRALDLGCAVGRSSYELSAVCDEVIGIDYSNSFIQAAEHIRSSGELPYARYDEARASTPLVAKRPMQGRAAFIRFEQGDAMHLREGLGSFDVVHAANLLCRLTDPKLLLLRLPSLVKPGGQLLLTTPCTWLEEFTPEGNWPTGSTFDWLQAELSKDFTLAERKDLPFLIREHARKFQWSVALGTRWVRKAC